MWQRFIPQNFNDFLCLIGLIIITGLWVGTGMTGFKLPEAIIGATIVTWTLLFNFYFRRAPKNGGSGA